MKKIMEAYKKDAEMWNTIVGMFLSVVGIIISIVSMVQNPNNFVIAVSVIACQVILVIYSIISLNVIYKSRKALSDAEQKMIAYEQVYQKKMNSLVRKLDQNEKFIERLVTYDKNINKRINNFLTLACDESDEYYYKRYLLQEQYKQIHPNNEEAKKTNMHQQKLELKRYEESLYSLYNRYIKGVFEEVTNIITVYLRSVGKPAKVSVSMKLFDVTYCSEIDTKSIRIFTAFRDKETYEKTEREIGGRHYSITANGDFQLCLTKESYIRNNIPANAGDYANENYPSSMQYYNSTVVVPIICDYKSDKNIFGYLCCDTLNEDTTVEVFDKKVSDIMYTAALTMGIFFDTINSCWDYTDDLNKKEFLTFVHDKCYKGI